MNLRRAIPLFAILLLTLLFTAAGGTCVTAGAI
jgi:hypothetical protein